MTATSSARSAVFAPLAEARRAFAVADRLADGILLGILAPGERLPSESALAQRFGVATVTVRESLAVLRDRGLVETRRGRGGGSFVTLSEEQRTHSLEERIRSLSRAEIADLGIYSLAIVGAGAERAASVATPREVEGLRIELERADFSDEFAARRALGGFHLQLVALSQSVRLVREQVRVQHDYLPLLWICLLDDAERDAARMACGRVVAALAAGDAETARRSLADSVQAAVRWLLRAKNELEAP